MSQEDIIRDPLGETLHKKQIDAMELFDLIEEDMFALLSSLRDFRLHLMRIESTREKLTQQSR